MKLIKKFEYLFWATTQWPQADTSCPFCQSSNTVFVYRKYLVTSLRRCSYCELMFRVPKSNPGRDATFYEHQYQEGFTTDCPNEQELANLKQTSFKGTEKDYSSYIEVLKAAGLESGDTVFDFGCSWGYGSWQLSQAGFRVYSYEVSQSRARYAEEKLNCRLLPAPTELLERVDCFFSAHVIEHLSNPGHLWEIAKSVLKPDGVIVLFMPNGERQLEKEYGKARYHKLWGQVHPLLLTAEALSRMAQDFAFSGCAYSSPYESTTIAAGTRGALDGAELLFVARRTLQDDPVRATHSADRRRSEPSRLLLV